MFAELLELVVAHGLKIQAPLPAYAAPTTFASGNAEEVLVSAIKPLLVLQNPGYYYYTAGNCAVQRKVMFERASRSDVRNSERSCSPSMVDPCFTRTDEAGKLVGHSTRK